MVFQHPRINTLQELRQVMLSNLGAQFNEITEVGYLFLSPQPNRRPVWMLVWLLNDEHVRNRPGKELKQKLAAPIQTQTNLESMVLHLRAPMAMSQVEFDALRISDPMRAGIADNYNTDGGVEFRVGHRLRNRDVVHMAVKNYNIRRNAEYRVVESDRIKYHCRCKHAADGCPWSIQVALRQTLV
ncbi:hypothetical protein PIB30_106180 [Stylosanthes scabra]|uniref:Transposase MuDR plant domain-containing protein n=1 Tax=Stylosanthes scabra TaxID=79078 RepID=A0ABU6W2Q5_9FABA|nr:hypothetical protein [Stylosanthes scabra]